MYLFWEPVISKIFSILQPKNIVEIGSDHGDNTKNILDYCKKNNALLHVIDPLPKYDETEWQKEYGELLVFQKTLSLSALSQIEKMDAVLIDGDHNWYTVFNELKLIEQNAKKHKTNFPIIFLHDIGWPYGRRDLYYNPDNIPEAYRQPYKKKGIIPGQPDLADEGGLNPHLFNAIYENNLHNGVLTAVEDFLKDTDENIQLIKIPAIYGLGILYPEKIIEKLPELGKLLADFTLSDSVLSLIKVLEKSKITSEISSQDQKKLHQISNLNLSAKEHQLQESCEIANKLQVALIEQEKKISEQGSIINELEKVLEKSKITSEISSQEQKNLHQISNKKLSAKEQQLQELSEVANKLQVTLAEQEERLAGQGTAINELESKLSDKEQQLQELSEVANKLQVTLAEQEEKLVEQGTAINELESELSSKDQQLQEYRDAIKKSQSENYELGRWLEQIAHDHGAFMDSWRWKVGNKSIRIVEKVIGRPKVKLAIEHIGVVLDSFDKWKSEIKHLNFGTSSYKRHGLAASPLTPKEMVLLNKEKASHEYFDITSFNVDIVICVHNALDDVKNCLNSVIEKTNGKYILYIVNDGSDTQTSDFLNLFATQHKQCKILSSKVAEGYTKAANKGLRASTGDYVILLNSDTVVPLSWLERIIECGESNPKIGIIGPLSNAASWQSVPERFDDKGDWAVNKLPVGWNVDTMATLVDQVSTRTFPKVPLVNGFCFAIKRTVINKIGYLDEVSFPKGYGEENDYCVRTINAGFELAIADNAYVYHAKSRSFGHNTRIELSKQGSEVFRKKHGNKRIDKMLKEIQGNKTLMDVGAKIAKRFEKVAALDYQDNHVFSVMFILPVHGGGGGSHSVVQESLGLMKLGVNVCIANKKSHKPYFLKAYSNIYESHPGLFYFYNDEQDLVKYAANYQVVVATVYHSVKVVQKIINAHPRIAPGYYIQDYEPWFFEKNTDQWKEAYDSYTLVPHMTLFAKTKWLCRAVEEHHAVKVNKISPGLDPDIFYPIKGFSQKKWPVKLSAMVRPNTPRRGPVKTMRLLNKLKKEFGERVDVHIFGCDEQSPDYQNLERDFEFTNHGVLEREKVAGLLRESDIFIDLSDFQAFGRTGLEAMACGCTTILPVKGGVHEFAIDYENSLLVDTTSEQECETKARELIVDYNLRLKLRNTGLLKATEYSVRKAALTELLLLEGAYKGWVEKHAAISRISNTPKKLFVAGFLPYTSGGTFGGSAYIRTILPLTHSNIKDKFEFRTVNFEQIFKENPDVVLVQRNAIQSVEDSQLLVNYCIQQHIIMVYEIDDDLFQIHGTHEESIMYKATIDANKFFAMNADLVIVSSEMLKKKIHPLNPNIKIIPNYLDEKLWIKNDDFINSQHNSISTRILYQGTATHYDDLMFIEKPFKKLKAKYGDKLFLDIIGIIPHTKNVSDWCNIIEVPNDAKKDYPSYVRWITGYNQWHIGIAPLVDNEFNRCKSYIKFLDYSALGLATIASDLGFYKNNIIIDRETGLLVKNTEDAWYVALEKLIMDKQLRKEIANNAHLEFKKNHTLKVTKEWREAFEEILPNGGQ